tara:strand:+ start:523 stop:684 length:162 start_codon:yes stop_codon:yes gene_type:complete
MINDEIINKVKELENLKDVDIDLVKKIISLLEEKKDESDLSIKSKIIEIIQKG